MIKILLLLTLLLTSSQSYSSSCPDGSEPIKSVSDDGTYFVYNCNASNQNDSIKNQSSHTTNKDLGIKIYDVTFSPAVLDKLLNLVVSKTDFDFSKYTLSNKKTDVLCRFRITRIVYEKIKEGQEEGWNIAEGNINIRGSNVEFGDNAIWRMGGLSTDPSYLKLQVNIKLTDDGHFVGKMAYFNLHTNDGEVPINPMYPILVKHKRSTPINIDNITNMSAKFYIDVEDWAGGLMYISNCKEL
jgi:hypothetical protein